MKVYRPVKIPPQRSRSDIAFDGGAPEKMDDCEKAFRDWTEGALVETLPGGVKRCPSAGDLAMLRVAFVSGWRARKRSK